MASQDTLGSLDVQKLCSEGKRKLPSSIEFLNDPSRGKKEKGYKKENLKLQFREKEEEKAIKISKINVNKMSFF